LFDKVSTGLESKSTLCLRLKKDEFVEVENNVWQELDGLGLEPGISVKVTKTKQIVGFNLACKWKRKILGVAPKEGWFILTNLNLELALRCL